MEVCFLVLEPHFCCQIVPCKFRPINFGFSTLRRCSGQLLDFRFRPNHRSNLRNQFTMRRPFFRSSSSQQNSDCQPQLLPTIVRLAPTTHPGERSLPIGDELAESPLVSKSRITQIVPVSRKYVRSTYDLHSSVDQNEHTEDSRVVPHLAGGLC